MAKRESKFYKYYRSHQSLCNWLIIGALFGIALIFFFATGTLTPESLGAGKNENAFFTVKMTWFSWVMVAVLVVCLIFGIMAMIRDRSDAAQEEIRQDRIEAAKLQREALDERQREIEEAYNRMKERRAARLAAKQAAQNGGEEHTSAAPEEK